LRRRNDDPEGQLAGCLVLVVLGLVGIGLAMWDRATCSKWEAQLVERTHCRSLGGGQTQCDTRMVTEEICVERRK
jgi:hypothetical protein